MYWDILRRVMKMGREEGGRWKGRRGVGSILDRLERELAFCC